MSETIYVIEWGDGVEVIIPKGKETGVFKTDVEIGINMDCLLEMAESMSTAGSEEK